MPVMDVNELKQKSVSELLDFANEKGVEDVGRARKKELIFKILQQMSKTKGEEIIGNGVLEILNDGYGFLRTPESSYLAGPDDIYVSPNQIRKFNLRKGDNISGPLRAPKDSERFFR